MVREMTRLVFGLLGSPGFLGLLFVAIEWKLEGSLFLQHKARLLFFTLHQQTTSDLWD